jgi:hypothetical protein
MRASVAIAANESGFIEIIYVYKQIRDSGKEINDATFTNVICYTAG